MERDEAEARLRGLIGEDLRALADDLGATVWKEGKLNKGWAGHTIELYLGLPLNSSRNPNLGSWELKQASLRYLKTGELRVKETMQLTMINPKEVESQEFQDSTLYQKIRRTIVVSRIFENKAETRSLVHSVAVLTLDDEVLYNDLKADYDLIRETIIEKGFDALTGRLGKWVQPRTKGPGHGSTSRAFYARKNLVARIVGVPV